MLGQDGSMLMVLSRHLLIPHITKSFTAKLWAVPINRRAKSVHKDCRKSLGALESVSSVDMTTSVWLELFLLSSSRDHLDIAVD
jgi:hypothetical protein